MDPCIYESEIWCSLSDYAVILIQLWNHLNNNVSNEFIIYKQYLKTIWIFITVPVVTFAMKSSSSSVSDNGNIILCLCNDK